jgi:predicted DNA-binding transcriptional regulator AlpA
MDDPVSTNIYNTAPASAAAQAATPHNRGERRARAARSRKQTPPPEARAPPLEADLPPYLNIDLARPETWPALLRISEICRDPKRNYPGILPMTRSAFLDAVRDGYIPEGIKLGAKILAWRREDILHVVQHGVVGRREQARRTRALEAQRRAAAAADSEVVQS